MGLNGTVRYVLRVIDLLHDEVRLAESSIQVPELHEHLCGEVLLRLVDHRYLRVLVIPVKPWGGVIAGVLHIEEGVEGFVLDLYLPEGFTGCFRGLGSYERNTVAHETHHPVEKHPVIG